MPSSAASARSACSRSSIQVCARSFNAAAMSSSKPWICASSSTSACASSSTEPKPSVTSSWAITSSTFSVVDEQLGQLAELAVAPLALLALRDDVDVPAGQLRGQAHVLAAPADGDVLHVVRAR